MTYVFILTEKTMLNNAEVKLYQSQWIWRFLKIGLITNKENNSYIQNLPKIHIEIIKDNKAALNDYQLIKSEHIQHIINYIKKEQPNADNISLLRNVCVINERDNIRDNQKLVFKELVKPLWVENLLRFRWNDEKDTFEIMKVRETGYINL